jgi:hypothetical protein
MTQNLASLLSADWLDDELINAGGNFIMHLLGTNSWVDILNVFHLHYLTNTKAQGSIGPYQMDMDQPCEIDARITVGDVNLLHAPHIH